MFNPWQRIKVSAQQIVDLSIPNMKILGLVGVFGMPIAYIYWTYIVPQPYENISIRIIGSLTCIPIVFADRLPKIFKPYLWLYFLFGLTYNLPFIFGFMLFKNDYALMWQLSFLLSLILLMFIVSDWFLVLIIFIAGTLLSFGLYTITTPEISWPEEPLGLLFIYGFAIVAGSLVNYKTEIINQERINTMASVASNIAHELRTPLLGIKSAATGLKQYLPTLLKGYELARKNHLPVSNIRDTHYQNLICLTDRIIDETEHSNTFIDMLLINADYRRIHRSEEQNYSMASCINMALNRYPFQSDNEIAKIHWETTNDFVFHGIDILVMHIIFNLIKNSLYSIKSANKGEIFIKLKAGRDYNELSFKDTGQGIPQSELPYIFNRFSTTKSYGTGSGIGLSFCRDIMNNLGGRITVEAVENEYSEFILSFPTVQTLEETKSKVSVISKEEDSLA